MRVGTLCFATCQGLGYLAKAFFDHGIVTDVMMVAHGRREEHPEWYLGHGRTGDIRSPGGKERLREFCRTCDVMLFFETPFCWELLDWCREDGVKTVLMPMHECMPDPLPSLPYAFLCPSTLDYAWAEKSYPSTFRTQMTVPVDTKAVPWRQRERAEIFVHNAGHGGLRGRNGTAELLEALSYVESPARLIIRSQGRMEIPFDSVTSGGNSGDRWGGSGHIGNVQIRYDGGTVPYDQLWTEGDVFVFPEKFNGLSLPLQEARASGMLVMGTARFPMTEWLPGWVRFANEDGQYGLESRDIQLLIPPREYRKARVSPRCVEFDEAVVDPRDIAARIDEWYGQDISEYSQSGREWAEANSWEVLGPKYKTLLEGLL